MTKILYLEGRPSAHILHRRLATSVSDKIVYIDPKIQWQDREKSFFSNFYAWIRNAFYLRKHYEQYDIFLVDNLHFTPVIMNLIFPFKKKKLVLHLGSHTLYFMHAKKFSKLNNWIHKKMLAQYDYLLCEGEMARDFVRDLLGIKMPTTYTTFLGPPSERLPILNTISPDLDSITIVIVANGPAAFRKFYKGLDIMINAFEKAAKLLPLLELRILGEWHDELIVMLLSKINPKVKARIHFMGKVINIEDHLRDVSLSVHCSRGDAFPTSTLETMAAGIPTLVSEWTGTKEVVVKVDSKLVVPLEEEVIANRIIWYFEQPLSTRRNLSDKCRKVVLDYTEEKAIEHYKRVFSKICDN